MNLSVSNQPADRAGNTRRAMIIAVTLLAYYFLTMGGHHYSIDGIIVFQAARNWVVRHSLFFDPPLRWGDNLPQTSKYGLGLSLSYLPILLPLHQVNPNLFELPGDLSAEYNLSLLQNDLYRYASIIHPLVGALTGVAVYFLGRELRLSPRWATFAALAVGLASPFATYVRYDFAQPLIGLLLVVAAWLALRARWAAPAWSGLGLGLVLGYAVLTRFTSVLMVPWLGGFYYFCAHAHPTAPRSAWRWGLLLATLGVSLSIAATLLVNAIKFGSPLEFGQTFGFSLAEYPTALFGLLLSPGRGLLLFYPLAWLFIFGWPLMFKRRPAFAGLVAGIVLTELLLYAAWAAWWGGETWGPRYFVPTIPFMTLGVALWLEHHNRRGAKWPLQLGVGLTLLSLVISLNGILYNFLDFYSQYWAQHGFSAATGAAREQFIFDASPLFAGWRFALSPYAYDLYWLHQVAGSSRRAVIVVSLLSVSLVGAALLLLYPQLRRFPALAVGSAPNPPAAD